jgi:hypothetical protein
MRETRPSGSEGGGTEINRSSLPLSAGVNQENGFWIKDESSELP